jgi:hypothetical protein
MEEGSLLQQALEQQQRQPTNSAGGVLQNTLVVSVFGLFQSGCTDRPAFFLALAKECVRLNRFLHNNNNSSNDSCSYPWWSGGDGPVFGIHASEEGIPHLRAYCRYGPSVSDEWKLIQLLLKYTAQQQHTSEVTVALAVQCWDLDDGEVLLIQSAHNLPRWIDNAADQAALCRNRCWIVNGQVVLIEPTDEESESCRGLSVRQALQWFLVQTNTPPTTQPPPWTSFNRSIAQAIQTHVQEQTHCAAVALPRSVAFLVEKRPDLAAAACRAFAEQATATSHQPPASNSSSTTVRDLRKDHAPTNNDDSDVAAAALDRDDDWVWTTHRFGRTLYALLPNLAPEHPDAIPRRGGVLFHCGDSNTKQPTRRCHIYRPP